MKTGAIVGACALGLIATAAHADFTAYGDQAAWEADLISMGYTPFTETFDGLTIPDMQPGGGPYPINADFSIDITGAVGAFNDAFIENGEFHGEIFPATRHVSYVHQFNAPIVAFGQFYDGAASGLGIQIQTSEGSVDIFDFYTGFEDGFMGFISTVPVTVVEIVGSDANGGTAVGEIYEALDASYALVPGPASICLIALAGPFALRRRRR
jgi:hypothetical protein